jgi:protein Tex
MELYSFIQQQTSLSEKSTQNTLLLLEEGATIPFIARYRKEKTNGLDEVQIAQIRDTAQLYQEIQQRKKKLLDAIEKHLEEGKFVAPDLKDKVKDCFDLQLLEDFYLPFKQKKETRGEKAKQLGLEPLAKIIMSQKDGNLSRISGSFVKGAVKDENQALQGAADIIAEWMNESVFVRTKLRKLFETKSLIQTKVVKGKEEEGAKYRDYFQCSEPLYRVSAHRFLAMQRAESEGFIKLKVHPEAEEALLILERTFVKGNNECAEFVKEVTKDAYKRLLAPSLENETIKTFKEKADKEAIRIFASNLRQLLLSPPLGNKRILAIDPGYRTGCKLVCLDDSGDLLHNQTIYPHAPQKESSAAKAKLAQLVEAYKIDAIAIGDGTAGRETEDLVKSVRFNRPVEVFVVREDGASIYSASSVARKEFPTYDVTVRGSVSIGRRLMDPLAELVKIDPKSIGVGQYQHDVNQNWLKTALDDVVISCVNAVGVNLNTASPYLLTYVSGLGETLAENIVAYRTTNGPFKKRSDLMKVPRLGEKAFVQAAGFLRIPDGENPLDNSAVHPESYFLVEKMAKKLKCKVSELIGNKELLSRIKKEEFPEIDNYTFNDLLSDSGGLLNPSRDPRKKAKVLEFDTTIREIKDLRVGMKLNGIVTNVTAFGAFVNIGIKENGLIHKSKLADEYVDDPAKFIQLHEHVKVEIEEVDVERKRIALKRVKL